MRRNTHKQQFYQKMTNWLEYKGTGDKVELEDFNSIRIVEKLGSGFTRFFLAKTEDRTIQIMDALSELGQELGFRSMANRISSHLQQSKGGIFKNTEWLYDLHWYEEKLPSCYQQTSMILAVECEWGYRRRGDKNNDRYSAVKWDFQKLLITNADLRLMIFRKRIGNDDENAGQTNVALDKYFTETIQGYRNLAPGSKFLFIAFCDDAKNKFQYFQKVKSCPNLSGSDQSELVGSPMA
jgi:hypothetical protein